MSPYDLSCKELHIILFFKLLQMPKFERLIYLRQSQGFIGLPEEDESGMFAVCESDFHSAPLISFRKPIYLS